MRLLVTRPEPDATELKAHLVAQGHEVLVEPLITISFDNADPVEPVGVQALIATSRNALRAVAESPAFEDARDIPLFTVGPGTAATALALGFKRVLKGPGRAQDLLPVVAEVAEVNAGPLMHLAGDRLAFDLAGELRRLGFHVLQPTVYTTHAAQRFSEPIVARLEAREIDGVLLLSPRTAEIYARLIRHHGLQRRIVDVVHYCLSAAAAARLAGIGPLRQAVAAAPNLQEVLALVARAAPQSG